nr:retrotransposon protein, putative, unclassified [Tanacetum cinerariifolium]
ANIVLQGLPQDIYNLVNYHEEAKHIWNRVKLLIEGSKTWLQERESKLYDEFDMFNSVPGETIHSYYLRFAQLINDMHTIGMTMRPIQVNTKFINHLLPEWSKFVTDVKLAKDLHNTNFDHLYAYLRQHEAHADEVCIMKERFPNRLALVANTYNSSPSYTNRTMYHQPLSPFAQQQVSPLAPLQLNNVPMVQRQSH